MITQKKEETTVANAKDKNEVAAIIQLRRLEEMTMEVPIIGVTPVIPHKWSEKSLKMMHNQH